MGLENRLFIEAPPEEDAMLQIQKILIPRDFSDCAEEALRYGLDLARRVGAEAHLLFVEVLYADAYAPTATGPSATDDDLQARLLEDIEGALPDDLAGSVTVECAVARDIAAAPAIIDYAKKHDIDLVVMGTHGRRGLRRVLLGSVAEEVVRTAPCPVLCVRRRDPDGPPARNALLVPIDFSKHAQVALRYACELARLYDARLDLLHVVEDQFHPVFYNVGVRSIRDMVPDIEARATRELERFYLATGGVDLDVRYHVRTGHAAQEIVEFAREYGSSLVVLSTHGLRGLEHFLLGSVTEKVVRGAPAPVFTVKAFGKHLLASAAAAATTEHPVP